MTVKTILKQRLITPILVARNRESGKVPAGQQAGANACTGGDNPGGTNVVRFAPIAEQVQAASGAGAAVQAVRSASSGRHVLSPQ